MKKFRTKKGRSVFLYKSTHPLARHAAPHADTDQSSISGLSWVRIRARRLDRAIGCQQMLIDGAKMVRLTRQVLYLECCME